MAGFGCPPRELAIFTKGSGLALIGLPLAMVVARRDNVVWRRSSFWLAQLGVIAVYLPWHFYTWKMVRNGMEGAAILKLIVAQTAGFLGIFPDLAGWPLLIGMAAGAIFALRRDASAFVVVHMAIVALTLAFHCISPNGVEPRRVFMAFPSMLLLSAYGASRFPWPKPGNRWRTATCAALAIVSCASIFTLMRKSAVGYRDAAQWIVAHTNPEQAVLVASQIDGEGMFISEVAQLRPRPEIFLLRASKILADSDWGGLDYKLTMDNPAAAQTALDSIPIRFLVIDRFLDVSSLPHREMVDRLIATSNRWILRHRISARLPNGTPSGEIFIYEAVGSKMSKVENLRINMRRMLGREIVQ